MVILVDASKEIYKIQRSAKHECFLKKYNMWFKLKALYFIVKKLKRLNLIPGTKLRYCFNHYYFKLF